MQQLLDRYQHVDPEALTKAQAEALTAKTEAETAKAEAQTAKAEAQTAKDQAQAAQAELESARVRDTRVSTGFPLGDSAFVLSVTDICCACDVVENGIGTACDGDRQPSGSGRPEGQGTVG